MNIIRKLFGLPVIFLIGVPILIAVIWTAGITKAVLTPDFYVNIPEKLLEEGPRFFEELLSELESDIRVSDPNTRAWIRAFSKNETSFSQLIEQSGIRAWFKNEVVYKISLIGKMLKGDIPIRQLRLNLQPLKKALQHKAIKDYMIDTLNNLPECDQSQIREWAEAMNNSKSILDLPACRPVEPEVALSGLEMFDPFEIDNIPDGVPLIENVEEGDLRFLPVRINIFKLTMFFMYLLFLLPFIVIFLGAMITGKKSRWFGIGLSTSGLLSYLLAKLSFGLTEWFSFAFQQEHYLTASEEIIVQKLFSFSKVLINPLLTNIDTLSGFVFLAGLAFFAFSFYRKNSELKPVQVQSPTERNQVSSREVFERKTGEQRDLEK
jgi:hypothetical protein